MKNKNKKGNDLPLESLPIIREVPEGAVLRRKETVPVDMGNCGRCDIGTYEGYEWIDEVLVDGQVIGIMPGRSLYGCCNYCGY